MWFAWNRNPMPANVQLWRQRNNLTRGEAAALLGDSHPTCRCYRTANGPSQRRLANALGYPGFSHIQPAKPKPQPSALLVAILSQAGPDARLVEALPWLVRVTPIVSTCRRWSASETAQYPESPRHRRGNRGTGSRPPPPGRYHVLGRHAACRPQLVPRAPLASGRPLERGHGSARRSRHSRRDSAASGPGICRHRGQALATP